MVAIPRDKVHKSALTSVGKGIGIGIHINWVVRWRGVFVAATEANEHDIIISQMNQDNLQCKC